MTASARSLPSVFDSAMSRRHALRSLLGLVVVASAGAGCAAPRDPAPLAALPDETPSVAGKDAAYADAVDALFDVFVPAERDASGAVKVGGAREALADRVLGIDQFVPLAITAGLLGPMQADTIQRFADLGGATRAAVNVALDAMASFERPLTRFQELPRLLQERIVDAAMHDDAQRPAMLVMRAVAFAAWLGALYSDRGLVAVGFPPFEDFADGLAVSGYPRTRAGRWIDAEKEDLAALRAKNDLDDYTYNRVPDATPGDDLGLALDSGGDLR